MFVSKFVSFLLGTQHKLACISTLCNYYGLDRGSKKEIFGRSGMFFSMVHLKQYILDCQFSLFDVFKTRLDAIKT